MHSRMPLCSRLLAFRPSRPHSPPTWGADRGAAGLKSRQFVLSAMNWSTSPTTDWCGHHSEGAMTYATDYAAAKFVRPSPESATGPSIPDAEIAALTIVSVSSPSGFMMSHSSSRTAIQK